MESQFFVCKAVNFDALRKCIETGQWAYRDRLTPPQPRIILSEAVQGGKVILLFSVNGCHGWHGYCEVVAPPGSMSDNNDYIGENSSKLQTPHNKYSAVGNTGMKEESRWFYFPVKWRTKFLPEFSDKCLLFEMTECFKLSEGETVNKSRNWQHIPRETGEKMCGLMDKCYDQLIAERHEKLVEQMARQPPEFYSSDGEKDVWDTWQSIVTRVEEKLGKVVLACPFGSQRYNVQTSQSDMDMFLVFQAPTKTILSLNPPKQTVKNSDAKSCDYTIHELQRYSELLVSGDPRCVETLFLHESSVIRETEAFKELKKQRHLFLNRQCLDKYLRDALGSNGLKQLDKRSQNMSPTEPVQEWQRKLGYIITRLLQNARDIAKGKCLQVYRPENSEEWKQLMSIRGEEITYGRLMEIIKRYQNEIDDEKETVMKMSPDLQEVVEDWLIKLRFENFQECH